MMATGPTAAALAAAEHYQRSWVPYTSGPQATLLLDHARVRPRERVVDIACGAGAVGWEQRVE